MGFVIFASQLAAGCGEDTPERLSFALPTSSIDLATSNPQWRSAPAAAVPAMVCAGPEALGTDCCSPPAGVPATGVDCAQYPVACDPSNHLCALTFEVQNKAVVDLLARVAEVSAVDGRVFTRAEISSLSTWVENAEALATLPIRSADLFIGPKEAVPAGSPGLVFLSALALTEQTTQITPSAEAQQAFSGFARDYRMPFALWISAHVVVAAGSTPSGSVTVHVDGRAQAWY
jgi:hypothetical protein